MRFTVAVAFLLLCAASAHAQVYKWTDAQGRVHYSAQPPPNAQTQEIRISPPPPSVRPAAEAATLPPAETASDPAPEPREEASQQAIFRQNCEIARQNLAVLQDESIRRFREEEGGEPIYYTAEQRQAKIEQAQKMMSAYCE